MDKKEIIERITSELGDLFVYNININFQIKKTEIDFGEYITENSLPIKKVIFKNVIWQEFSEFDFCNIFNTIEIDNNFEDFKIRHFKYFDKMKNHISNEQIQEIKEFGNKYYTFKQTSGINCFIVTKIELEILNI